jgi:hypothetical protein
MERLRLHGVFFVSACFGFGCGGGTKPAITDASATSRPAESVPSGESVTTSDGEANASPAPMRASCDDGACSVCGEAMCPTGWYCDEGAKGGPACGWLPECAQKSGCSCLKQAFAGCTCNELDGAAHLSCR